MKTLAAVAVLMIGVGFAGAVAPERTKFEIVSRIKMGGEGSWDYLTVEPKSRRLFISRSTRVDVVSVATDEKIGEVTGLKGTHQAVFDLKRNHGFTSNGGDSTVTVFNLKNLKEIEKINVGKRPDAIVFDSSSGRVFTFNAESQDATAIDAKTLKVVGTVPLGGKPEFPATDGKGHVFVNVEDTHEIREFDAKTLKAVKNWSIAPGEEPTGLAMDVKNRRLFSTTSGKLVVSDADAGKVVAVVPIGEGPDAAEFDASLGLVFVSCGDGTLSVIREDTPDKYTVVQTVETQRGARTCTLDPKTHRIFLAVAETKAGEGNNRRRQMVPGTFSLLVVGRR